MSLNDQPHPREVEGDGGVPEEGVGDQAADAEAEHIAQRRGRSLNHRSGQIRSNDLMGACAQAEPIDDEVHLTDRAAAATT